MDSIAIMTCTRLASWGRLTTLAAAGALSMAVVAAGADGQPLRFVEAQFDGAAGVDGLDNAHSAAVSPDGKFVYVASDQDDAVAVFSRDTATGKLSFVEAQFDGVGGVDGLDGAESLALSPGGEHLYAAGLLDAAVAVFSRDTGTGVLTFVEVLRDGVSGVDGLAGASWVAVSPDGANVYVAGRFDDAVAVFSRDSGTGELTFLEAEIDGSGGVDGLADVTSVAVSPDGAHVYAAGILDQEIAIFDRNTANGTLVFSAAVADMLPNSEIDIDDHHGLAITPDGAHVYVTNHVENSADGWIAGFVRNQASGALTAVSPVLLGGEIDVCLLGIEGDSGIAIAPDGELVYATLPWDSAVALLQRNAATGVLTVVDAVCDETIGMGSPPGDPDGLWDAEGAAVSPDGRHAYFAAGNLEDAVAVVADANLFADGFESGDTSAWSTVVP